MSTDLDTDALFTAAERVRQQAYARFSTFKVGAAVLDEHGVIHAGCNVENSAYPAGICAEANAIGSMVASGARRIVAIAIVGGVDADVEQTATTEVTACYPCGGCRQRINEFADNATLILVQDENGTAQLHVSDLLPHAFRLDADHS